MKQKCWMFLSNHAHVFAYITKYPRSTTEEIARKINLSMRGVQNIVVDLDESGYIEKVKEGRSNRYLVHPELPMRHRLEKEHTVGDILHALGFDTPQKSNVRGKRQLDTSSTNKKLNI